MTPTRNLDSGTAVRAEKSLAVLAAGFQVGGDVRHSRALVDSRLARGVGDRQVTLSRDVAGAVRVPVRELDRVGVSGCDNDPTEMVHGVVQSEDRRLLPAVRGAGRSEAAVDLVR